VIDATHFPESMQEIVQAIGVESMLKLAKDYGGSTVGIPTSRNLTRNHPVVRLLGEVKALALAKIVGGSRLIVPTCRSVNCAIRDAEILEQRENGKTVRWLSRTYGVTERQVMHILQHQRSGS
jgi:hypothetical protein